MACKKRRGELREMALLYSERIVGEVMRNSARRWEPGGEET
jgi:hypothetical protein